MPPKRRVDNTNKSYIDEDEVISIINNNNNQTTTATSPDQTPMIIEKDKKRKFEEISNNNKATTTTTTTTTITATNNNNNNNYNNNNNNNLSIFDTIDINGLNKKTKDGLIIIAKSMGISTLTGNKGDIIKRIENSVQNYRSSNRKQNKQQTALVNRFDSTSYNLPIKSIEPLESLFWKIFRNKWLFLYLIGYLKNYENNQFDSFGYDYFINVRTMVLSGESKYGLLQDKVITNRSLVFDSVGYYSNEYLVKLFRVYKNNGTFLQSLFKNYTKQIGTIDKIVEYTLLSNSMLALQILIDQYNYVPTVKSTLYQAILHRCSIKTLEFIIGKIGHRSVTSQINENLDEFYQQHLLNDSKIEAPLLYRDNRQDEVIKQQTDWTHSHLVPQPSTSNIDESTIHRFKLINYLIDKKLISLPSSSSISKITESFNIGPIEKQFCLKDLINSCKSITMLLPIDESNGLSLSLKEINQMESKFTKQELRSILLPLFDIGSLYRDNQDIKQLFEFYLQQSTFKNNKVYFYLIYGATVEQFEKIQSSLFYYPFNLKTPNENYFRYALKVCSIEFFQVYFSKKIESNTNVIPKIENILFSLVQPGSSAASKVLAQERKFSFIKQYIQNYNIAKNNIDPGKGYIFFYPYGYPLLYIFCLIITTGDVELITEFHRLSNGEFGYFSEVYQSYSYYYQFQYNPLHYCKSPDMAEFLFNNYREELFEPVLCPYSQQNVVRLDFSWYFTGEIEILKRMEKIIDPKDYSKYLPSIHLMDLYNSVAFNIVPAITPPGITKTMCHMIDNPLVYKKLKDLDLYHICAIPNDQKCVEEIKYIFENTNFKDIIIFELFPQQETHHNGKSYNNFKYKRQLLNWAYEKCKGDSKGRHRFGDYDFHDQSRIKVKQFASLYLANKLDDLLSDPDFNASVNGIGCTFNYSDATLFDLIALAIGKNGDINTFERILKMNPNDIKNNFKSKKSFIQTVLIKSIQVGRIDFLEYLFENHKQTLVVNSKKDTSGLFDQKEFKLFISTAIANDRISIVEFFFEILGFKLPSPQILKIFKTVYVKDIVYNNYKLKFGLPNNK